MEALNYVHKSPSALESEDQNRIWGRELTNSIYRVACWSHWPSWRGRGRHFCVPCRHCQAGLTSVCLLQMKKPSKQGDFSNEPNFHSAAYCWRCFELHWPTHSHTTNVWGCPVFKIDWNRSLLALCWACPNLCISRTLGLLILTSYWQVSTSCLLCPYAYVTHGSSRVCVFPHLSQPRSRALFWMLVWWTAWWASVYLAILLYGIQLFGKVKCITLGYKSNQFSFILPESRSSWGFVS